MTVSEDDILERAAALPRHDSPRAATERIRGAALAAYRAGPAPRGERSAGLWTRFLEPALVVVSVAAYLGWTASTLTELHALSAAGGDPRGETGAR